MIFRRTNGGLYPEKDIAAYLKTYVNKLRSYERTPYNEKDKVRARYSLMNK